MTATRKRIAKPLEFEITAPLGMGLSKGETGLRESADISLWLRFSVCPSELPSQQHIYLAPREEERDDVTRTRCDPKKWRRLTTEIEGSLRFNVRQVVDPESGEVTKPPIGTLYHAPEYTGSCYGHAEFYYIEINLLEDEFRKIWNAFLTGKRPTAITIWTPDVEYGDAPDGSDKVWEVWDVHGTDATIVGFSLELSTDIPRVNLGPRKSEKQEENDLEETAKVKQAILHSREDIQLLCSGQAASNSSVAGLRKQINILLAVAIVIAVIMALHFKF